MLKVSFAPSVVRATILLLGVVAQVTPASSATVEHIRVPDGGIQPQAQVDQRGRVHLIFFKGDPKRGDVFYAHSDDLAKTFSKSVRVNSQPGSVIAAGIIRGPQLAVGKGGRPHVTWMGSDQAEPKIDGEHTPMLYARLNDAEDAFEAQRNIIQQHPGLDGGGSVAADAEGNVYVAWHAPKDKVHGGHAEADRRIWIARSTDNGRTFAEEAEANPDPTGVCGCCGLRLFADRGGHVIALYRSATQTIHRDMYLLASTDRGRTFKGTKVGPWQIPACVMSTAAFAQGAKGTTWAAWEQEKQVRVAPLHPTTLQPGPQRKVPGSPEQNQKHPTLAVADDGTFVVAWVERARMNQPGQVVWQVFDAQGAPVAGADGRVSGLTPMSVPAVIASPGGAFTILY